MVFDVLATAQGRLRTQREREGGREREREGEREGERERGRERESVCVLMDRT